jgi:hypothetical protein
MLGSVHAIAQGYVLKIEFAGRAKRVHAARSL